MVRFVLEFLKSNTETTAIIIDNRSYSYTELYSAAQSVAYQLNQEDTTSGLVGIYTDNNFYTYASILGTLISGKGFVPLNSKFPDQRLMNIIEQTEIEVVICCTNSVENVNKFSGKSKIISADTLKTPEIPVKVKTSSNPAYILFTSGSTGEPKGIPISKENFNSFLTSLKTKYHLNSTNRVLQCFELSFDVSIACTFLAFSTGATLVVSSLSGIVAVNAFKTILDYEVDFVTIAPSAVSYLESYKLIPQFKMPFVKSTLFTGEALPFEFVEKWKASAPYTRVYNAYGPTEATVWCYFYLLDENTEYQVINGLCPIGTPLEGIEARIAPLENENKGQLMLSGKHIFEAYWKNEPKSLEAFKIDKNGQKWYKTGDLVQINKFGNLVYINRLDNQVKVNGYRIELGEIEHKIKMELKTSIVVVVVSKDQNGNNQLTAFIDMEIDVTKFLEKLRNLLPFYMIPRGFKVIKQLPLNNNGKTDRKKLTELANGN
jgi:D-alanine--poly(phosphoribitol) ligase subunit 1